MGDFLNKTAALLLCLLGAAVAQDDDAKKLAAAARKAERIAAQGRKLHEATKDIWKKFVFEYRELPDDDLAKIVKNYEKAVDLFQKSCEFHESPGLNRLILVLAKRIAQARMVQTSREFARRPKKKPAPPPAEPPPDKAKPEAPPPKAEPEPEPEPEPERAAPPPRVAAGVLPTLDEPRDQRRRGLQGVRNFVMHYYFASRKQSAMVDRCAVCNGRGRRATHQLDRRRRVVTIPCNACHESGGHVNVPAARKGYWLCMSPLYRSDPANRAAWDQELASWRQNPNLIKEFLKSVKIQNVDYHGLWAEVTWVEKVRPMGAKRSFQRPMRRKVVRAGKRWFFYDEKYDRDFFATEDGGDE
ncbi:MAG: hypothetical protein ACYTG3_01115 [Planctomycetota bacterium]